MKGQNRFIFRIGLAALLAATALSICPQAQVVPTAVVKNGFDIDLRSDSRIFRDEIAASGGAISILDEPSATPGLPVVPSIQFRGGNLQVNDPGLDYIQQFTGFRSFVHYTQSETSLAAFGQHIVETYNTSAGMHLHEEMGLNGPVLVFDRIQLSGFSTSSDGGKTFTSGFFPGVDGDPFSFGDPSIDVDRHGNFYFAQLGETPDGIHGAITVNTSHDGGVTWGNAVVAAIDDGSDKEWLAVGPDPFDKSRDNVYVTWTSFQATGSELAFAKSTDGGVTWTSKIIFAPRQTPIPPTRRILSNSPTRWWTVSPAPCICRSRISATRIRISSRC